MELAEALDRLLRNRGDTAALARAQQAMAGEDCTPGQRCAYELAVEGIDVVAALERGPSEIRAALAESPEHDVAPAPGEWTARQVVLHVADNESVNMVRIRAVLTEDEPELYGYDSDDWTRFYNLETVETALKRWEVLRSNTVVLLQALSPEELSRRGVISYRGAESVRVLMAVLAGHDRDHVRQIQNALRVADQLSGRTRVV